MAQDSRLNFSQLDSNENLSIQKFKDNLQSLKDFKASLNTNIQSILKRDHSINKKPKSMANTKMGSFNLYKPFQ